MNESKPIAITGVWFRANATGSQMTVLIEVNGQWHEIANLKGANDGPTSHIIETAGLQESVKTGKVFDIH